MFKKLFVVVGLGLLVSGLLFGREVASYFRTSVGVARQSVKNHMPIQFEINRARDMIGQLGPEIESSMHTIAKEEASVESLEKEIKNRHQGLENGRKQVLRLNDDLAKGYAEYSYGGRTYTVQQVKTDLAARFANYKTREATVGNLGQILQSRKSGLEAARQKLIEMQAAKRQLEVDVENLEARLKMVEVAQTSSQFSFDDSHLARTRDLITDLSARLDVMSKLANAERSGGEIPLDEPDASNVMDEVAKHFGKDRAAVAEVSTAAKAK